MPSVFLIVYLQAYSIFLWREAVLIISSIHRHDLSKCESMMRGLTHKECSWRRCDPTKWSAQPTPSLRETQNTLPSDNPPKFAHGHTHTETNISHKQANTHAITQTQITRYKYRIKTQAMMNMFYDSWQPPGDRHSQERVDLPHLTGGWHNVFWATHFTYS